MAPPQVTAISLSTNKSGKATKVDKLRTPLAVVGLCNFTAMCRAKAGGADESLHLAVINRALFDRVQVPVQSALEQAG
jgi:hypothetical protein